jgi:hypothetical protein
LVAEGQFLSPGRHRVLRARAARSAGDSLALAEGLPGGRRDFSANRPVQEIANHINLELQRLAAL